MFDLNGKTAVVTGAGQNVGAGIAAALARQGARVVVNDLVAERAEAVATELVAAGHAATPSAFDVTDRHDVLRAIGEIGRVDVLVNNAGISVAQPMVPRPFREMSPDEWDAPIQLNVYGVMNCCHAVIDGMCDRGWGRIITISSGAGTSGVAIGVAPYSAGKGGGIGFTRTLALEVARSGVTANTLALGLMGQTNPEVTERLARAIPVGRTGTPEDIGAACVWLASDEAGWITAQTIGINGGAITS